jgi:large subunit ribosomal protein L1
MKTSKRLRQAKSMVDAARDYSLDEGLALLKSMPGAKFDETVELAIATGIDPKKADQALRGTVSLPKGIGKTQRVIAFCEADQVEAAMAAGAIEAGGEELAKKVGDGWQEFDVAIAAPSTMRFVGKLGRVLGPKGLMPSPKSGTVTPDVPAAVTEFAAGKIEYRADAGGNIHAPVGKKSFPDEDLKENILALMELIRRAKPASVKGRYITGVCLSSSMSPGIPITL